MIDAHHARTLARLARTDMIGYTFDRFGWVGHEGFSLISLFAYSA